MSRSLRKIKREREKISSPSHPHVMTAWNRGFEAGAKQQNELDTQLMMEWLGKLEEIPGIGPKTAARIREHYLTFILQKRKEQNGMI
ncbi:MULTISPECIES: hypothetical protein [Geobacillus]|jgi:hypothetical protein|uniref:hypothetical protein n=1 Tax=Geobacillus TaxID=129337 RepID=UPI0009BF1942|nr:MULTISPECIES: hypothetical protein [Geobacillus]MED0662216.1 hypothetical protein [Geobacillus thermodenitrificans]OQP08485.1 hypothetical protein B1691_15015 [Geobacillus sp. 47C-IIb]PJW19166.1 hypothetical protein CV632_17545 [Geobacillus thermodenitrificans]QNU32379.1 hypothetical protein IC804_06565 [Geobacillus sp. 47C-IIb]